MENWTQPHGKNSSGTWGIAMTAAWLWTQRERRSRFSATPSPLLCLWTSGRGCTQRSRNVWESLRPESATQIFFRPLTLPEIQLLAQSLLGGERQDPLRNGHLP